jgi:hypothetical protein
MEYPEMTELPVKPVDKSLAYKNHWLYQEYKDSPEALRGVLTQAIEGLTLIKQAVTEMEQNKFIADPGSSVNQEKVNIASFMESMSETAKIIGILVLTSDRLQAEDLPVKLQVVELSYEI